MSQTYYTFDFDEVIEFEGYLDTLYGTVSPEEKGSHRLPRQMFVLNRDVWRSYSDAREMMLLDCRTSLDVATWRQENALQKNPPR